MDRRIKMTFRAECTESESVQCFARKYEDGRAWCTKICDAAEYYPECIAIQPRIPTPAELAQQLADLTGRVVTLFQGYNKKWHIAFSADVFFRGDHDNWEGFDYPSNTVIAEINRPVAYTGDWKDSKVTATPQAVDGKAK
jgi:hypothetical protein